jgi:hypothetical protein
MKCARNEGRSSQALIVVLSAMLGVLLTLLAVGNHSSIELSSSHTTIDGVVYQEYSGTIRNAGNGWYVINDAGHEPDGISIGAVTSTTVQIEYPACTQIIFASVSPDETFAKLGATFGASVGLDNAIIQGKVNGTLFNPATWSNGSANIWFYVRCYT